MDRMNPEVRTAWLGRLRSGDYLQAFGKLRRDDPDEEPSFCCLGVLCELAVEAGVVERAPQSYSTVYVDVAVGGAGDRSDNYLPFAVQRWAGLDARPDPLVAGRSLGTWNDAGASFARLADLIEEHL